jgi:cation:H+ antiporter
LDAGTVAALVAGFVLLMVGAEALVWGASRLATTLGISSLAIGLTVVAFGTSAPELAVSVRGALTGSGDIALGNVVGSNIFNLLAILGLAALASALVVHRRVVRIDLPVLLLVTVAVWGLAANGRIGRGEGALLVAGLVGYTVWVYRAARREASSDRPPSAPSSQRAPQPAPQPRPQPASRQGPGHSRTQPGPQPSRPRPWPTAGVAVALGLAGLVVGAQLLVSAATDIAAAAGMSELAIGLTLVAAGTSLPELATSVAAAARGQRDIAVGNVVGSNLFNLLGVLGASALAAPTGLFVAPQTLTTDLPLALLATLAVLPCLATGLVIMRWEGGLLVLGYGGYLALVLLTGFGDPRAPAARTLVFVGLGLVAVVVTTVGWIRHRRDDAGANFDRA